MPGLPRRCRPHAHRVDRSERLGNAEAHAHGVAEVGDGGGRTAANRRGAVPGGTPSLHRPGGEAADDVLLQEEEQRHDRDRGEHRTGGEERSSCFDDSLRDELVEPDRERLRLGVDCSTTLAMTNSLVVPMKRQQPDDREDRRDEAQDDA